MLLIDVVLLIIISGFVFYGLFFGLIKSIGLLTGYILGAWAASHYYTVLYEMSDHFFFGYESVGKVFCFVFIFGLVEKITSLVFSIFDKTFGLIFIIPFIKGLNKFLGAILGLMEGILVVGLMLFVMNKHAVTSAILTKILIGSKLAPLLIKIAGLTAPFLSSALTALKGLI